MTSTRRRLGALLGTATAAAAAVTVALVALGPGVTQGAPTLIKIEEANANAPLAVAARSPAVSDDGLFAAFVGPGAGGAPQAFWRDIAKQQSNPVPGATIGAAAASAISGNGCVVAFWGSTSNAGPTVAPAPAASAPATPGSTPDGSVALFAWNRCTSDPAPSMVTPSSLGLTSASSVTRPALSSDGSVVAYGVRPSATDPWHLYTNEAETALAPAPAVMTTVDVSADGHTVAYDAGGPDLAGAPSSIALLRDGLPFASVPSAGAVMAMPSLAADGSTLAFVAGADLNSLRPYVFSTLTNSSVKIDDTGHTLQPAITPDGAQVAYTVVATPSGLTTSGPSSVVVTRSTSGVFASTGQETLSTSPVVAGTTSTSPAISATGQVALFASGNDQSSDVWLAQRQPALTVTPAFDLGTVAVGSSSQAAAVTFTNPSSVGVALGAVTGVTAPFSVAADTCSKVMVPPAGTCTVTVVFTPADAVDSTAAVTVDGPGLPAAVTATLSGRGRSLARSISISPSTVSFPSTAVGSRVGPVGATVTNSGEVDVQISAVSIGGSDGGQFVLTGNGCANASLAPRATCAIEVTAIPSRAGSLRGTLTVTGTQGESASATLAVSATSSTPPSRVTTTTRPRTTTATVPGRLSASPASVAFPLTEVGSTSAAVEVTIANVGASTVSRLEVTLSDDTQFAVDAGSCAGANLAAGRTCTVEVAITPQDGGAPYGALSVTGSRGETVSVALTMGTSSATGATIIVNPGVVQGGDTTTVIGSGFEPGIGVVVQLLAPNGDGPAITLSSTVAGADGNLRVLVQIPRGLGQGGWRVQAMADGEVTDWAAVLIQQAVPQPGSPGGGGVIEGVSRPGDAEGAAR